MSTDNLTVDEINHAIVLLITKHDKNKQIEFFFDLGNILGERFDGRQTSASTISKKKRRYRTDNERRMNEAYAKARALKLTNQDLWGKRGSAKTISKITGIPLSTVYRYIALCP